MGGFRVTRYEFPTIVIETLPEEHCRCADRLRRSVSKHQIPIGKPLILLLQSDLLLACRASLTSSGPSNSVDSKDGIVFYSTCYCT